MNQADIFTTQRLLRVMLMGSLCWLSGCAFETQAPEVASPPAVEPDTPATKPDGKYYKDDGPPELDAVDWRKVPNPEVSFAQINPRYNRPYEVFGVRYVPFKNYVTYHEQGEASWYGRRYHGRKTSSGEVYDMFAMSAAHTILPIPSYARVTRVDDGRSVIVRVNDRGPFLNDRLIDLSYTAARKLGVVETGTALVVVEAILPEQPLPNLAVDPQETIEKDVEGSIEKLSETAANYIQLAAFSILENAQSMLETLTLPDLTFAKARIVSGTGNLYRLVIGPYPDRQSAEQDLDRLHDLGMEALLKYF